ncbi:MAG: prepilin-type N-terminal cleavage/methylation domain-containing protein [Planctomycetes bacterium]|nr:prepilin-type N-terminal cleavage/methylation domain-containing protein [Planctomycetota bacterium]
MSIYHRSRIGLKRAYTLIEMLIVVALLGIAGALLIPHLVHQDNLTAQAAVRLLIADLSFAQSDSLANQEYRRVQFLQDAGGNGYGYCIVRMTEADFDLPFDLATADFISDPLGVVGEPGRYIVDFRTENRFDGVSIIISNFDGANQYITYDTLGGTIMTGNLPGTGGQIQLQVQDVIYQIDVSPFTGKLTVTKL